MRKPAHKALPARQLIWDAVRTRSAVFTCRDLRLETAVEVPAGTIKTYLRALTAAGIVEVSGAGERGKPHRYRLVKTNLGGEAPAVRPDGSPSSEGAMREALWRTLKHAGQVGVAELALLASTEEVPVSETAAAVYLRYLARAGYVRARRRKGRLQAFAFVKANDPGPKAPKVQRVRQVYDPNSGRVVWRQGDTR